MCFGAALIGSSSAGYGGGRFGGIPARALVDPILDGRDLLGSEWAASQRHLWLLETGDQAVQAALRGLARDDHGTVIPSWRIGCMSLLNETGSAPDTVRTEPVTANAKAIDTVRMVGFAPCTDVGILSHVNAGVNGTIGRKRF